MSGLSPINCSSIKWYPFKEYAFNAFIPLSDKDVEVELKWGSKTSSNFRLETPIHSRFDSMVTIKPTISDFRTQPLNQLFIIKAKIQT